MAPMFVEYREVDVNTGLHQGDIIEAVDATASMWERHLMVITADCDLAHSKHHGRIACVPILAAAEYHLELQIPRIRSRIAKKPLAELANILRRVDGPSITEARLREWASEETPDSVVEALNLDGANAKAAKAALLSLQLIDSTTSDLQGAISALVSAQMCATEPPKLENARNSVINELRQAYKQPPGDAQFLSAFAPGHIDGYFAYLRHLEQVWQDDISLGPSYRNTKYRRISRLQDRFIHALVQKFALVFIMIGLPDEYEDMRNFHAESIGGYVE